VVGLEALGQAHGMAAAGRPAAGAGLAAQAGHGLYGAAGDQMGDDAAHRGVGDGEAPRLSRAARAWRGPHRIGASQPLDRLHQLAGPGPWAEAMRPARARLGPLVPAIEAGAAGAHRTSGLLGGEPVVPGLSPAPQRVLTIAASLMTGCAAIRDASEPVLIM
jgi:hypothetical protein